jgi:hypothetical protein
LKESKHLFLIESLGLHLKLPDGNLMTIPVAALGTALAEQVVTKISHSFRRVGMSNADLIRQLYWDDPMYECRYGGFSPRSMVGAEPL